MLTLLIVVTFQIQPLAQEETATKPPLPEWAAKGLVRSFEEKPEATALFVDYWRLVFSVFEPNKSTFQTAIDHYSKLTDHPDRNVRQAAINALVALDAKDQAERIADKIDDPVEFVRQAAINALVALDAKDQAQRIADKVNDPERYVRQAAINALAALDAKDQAQHIADKINDPVEIVRQAAINALAALDAKDQAQHIADKIDDPDRDVSQAAIRLNASQIKSMIQIGMSGKPRSTRSWHSMPRMVYKPSPIKSTILMSTKGKPQSTH